MGKASMCIQMLQILNSGRIYKCSELAELLETNSRNIIEYKKELEEAGYYIISVPGKFGGYKLDQTTIIPSLKLVEAEKEAVTQAISYIKARKDFPKENDLIKATSKLYSSINHSSYKEEETYLIQRKMLAMPSEEISARYTAIERCIKERKVLNIKFLTNYNVIKERSIHPYKLFMMENAWFVMAMCETPRRIMPFKLNRIVDFVETQKTFKVSVLYNESEMFDKNGLKSGGDWSNNQDFGNHEWYHVKLELHGRPAMYVKEYIYGKNQNVISINRDKTILECDMQYKYNTIRFVLGFGSDCIVLEPAWLKDEVLKVAKEIIGRE